MYLTLESLLMRLDSCPRDSVQRYALTSPRSLPLPAPAPLAAYRSVAVGGFEYCTTTLTVASEGSACRSRDNFEDCAALQDAVSSTKIKTLRPFPHAALWRSPRPVGFFFRVRAIDSPFPVRVGEVVSLNSPCLLQGPCQ